MAVLLMTKVTQTYRVNPFLRFMGIASVLSRRIFTFTAVFGLLWAVQSCDSSPSTKSPESVEAIAAGLAPIAQGWSLLQRNCTSCHRPAAASDGSGVAPSLAEMRSAYLAVHTDRGAFIEAVASFSQNPQREQAIMTAALERYGLMPKIGTPEQELRTMAAYMYDHELGSEAWFQSLKGASAQNDKEGHDTLSHAERGRRYAMGTKQALGSKLLASINAYGAAGAVDFCNVHALPITDSMSTHFGASIKRVSDRPRNPANAANAQERTYIEVLKVANASGQQLPPLVSEKGSKVLAYYAIETNEMCLKCHGNPASDIAPETASAIARRYPADKAVGYGLNEIRGIFVVEMEP